MSNRTCSIEGCDKIHFGKSWCTMHYNRWRRHGDPVAEPRKEPKPKVPCSAVECGKWAHALGLCPMHYSRMRTYGSLECPAMPSVEERFFAKVQKTEMCWLWQASTDGKGYGQMRITSDGVERLMQAHRLSYELFVGPIPEGLVVDHICHVIKCVKPDHLRAVTHKQNMEHRSGAAKHSKTGVRGVTLKRGKYRATIGHNGEHFTVGHFSTITEAEAAATAARNAIFTHNDLDRTA